MLKECLEVFQKELERKTEKWLLENYVPKDGTYILINIEKNFALEKTPLLIKKDKKAGKVQGETDLDYGYISYLDYYSKLVEMNKPMDSAKIIHSNNMYAFFVKKESLAGKLTEKCIDGYYAVLKDPYRKYTKNNDKALYQQVEQQIGEVDTEKLDMICQWIKSNFRTFLENEMIDLNGKDYLKLFFVENDKEQTKQRFKQEGMRYLLPNIYNKNDYNQTCVNGIKGLPGNNMGMNAKKPYLDNKTRKQKMPCMLDLEKAQLRVQFFDYLEGQASKGKNDIYIDLDEQDTDCIIPHRNNEPVERMDTGIFLRIQQGKELEIHYMSRITGYRQQLFTPFQMQEVLEIPDKYLAQFEPGYGRKKKMYELENLFDDVFFNGKLKYNYFTKPEDIMITDGVLKNVLLIYRERLWGWFYKGETQPITPVLHQMAFRLIVNSIQNGSAIKAKHQLNLWVSAADYLEKTGRYKEMMNEAKNQFENHINSREEWDFKNDDEYYYAVGQLTNAFMQLNKSANKNMSFVNIILNAKSDEEIKKRLVGLFKKYNYAIKEAKDSFYFKNAYSHIMGYEPKSEVSARFVSYGYADKWLIVMKKDTSKAMQDNE